MDPGPTPLEVSLYPVETPGARVVGWLPGSCREGETAGRGAGFRLAGSVGGRRMGGGESQLYIGCDDRALS